MVRDARFRVSENRIIFFVATCVTASALMLASLWLIGTRRVEAAAGQGGVEQVTLNPGGGANTNGSDGIRFTVNTAAGFAGQDEVYYRNTQQYCCSAGAPMLNIGGALYGQAGAAYGSANWSSIEILSTSGATSVGSRTSSVGNSGATVRYTVVKGGLTYTVTRTVTYVYPNDYVTDSYSFVIPEGNTETVKFYNGGDTAPGSSDIGYGVMVTEPVRSVISLNTTSRIMFGFREIAGSKPFDGATSQGFSVPYGTVATGDDIGFVAIGSMHDAGLMMQWNLGDTPGTQTAAFQQFATQQGTNLNAAFSSNTTMIDTPVLFTTSIVNTELTTITGLGYTVDLPTGLVIGSGSQSNTCGGTVTAIGGTSTVVLSGGSITSASNCILSVPVVSALAGTYAVSSTNFSELEGALTNNVGASSLTVSNPALGTDLNDDGIEDSAQSNLYSYTSPITGKTVVLEVSDSCSVSSATSQNEESNEVSDEAYEYVNGLMNFELACGTPGFTSTIKQYYYGVTSNDVVLRKYNPNTQSYATITSAIVEQVEINGNIVTVVTYEVTDGGELDADETEDGNIVDPAGLAAPEAQIVFTAVGNEISTQQADLAATGESALLLYIAAASVCVIGIAFVLARRAIVNL